jgi:hypothetical protein
MPDSVACTAPQPTKDDVPQNRWTEAAVAERVGTAQATAELLRERAGDARPADLLPYLDAADMKPEAGDEALGESGLISYRVV